MSDSCDPHRKLDSLMEGYLDYARDVKRLAPNSIKDMRCTLRGVSQAMIELVGETPLWELPLTDYVRWVEWSRRHGRRPAGISKQISQVRGFLEYAFRSGRCDRNVLDGFQLADHGSRHVPDSLSLEEAEKLLKSCPSQNAIERRNRTIILLLYGCGLRTQELCQLDLSDVDQDRREITVRHAKGDKQRILPIPDAVHTELLAYLQERKGKRGPLFRTEHKRRRLSSRSVLDVVRVSVEHAGLRPTITPKVLRHSFATHLMDRGVSLAVIARLMGHRSPQETGVYLHVLEGRMRQGVDRLPAIDPLAEGGEP